MSSEVTKMSSGFQASQNSDRQIVGDETAENSVSIFSSDYKKHDDLKQMLDSNKDNLKLDAMKRIVGLIAKGKDASSLFPAVVKNVVSKNVEIKKLVYVYLMRYAEEQQDLALLSISTFQRALKDPNQLIRASALRVLSSIRVPIIVTIMMLAIKEAVSDMSPYVRKTAANAIPKLYSLDPDQKDDLVIVIEKLLADKTILVAGSAIQAFETVCPERIDLIHKNFRKLCSLLIDVDEWGQVIIINMLTRYARTQFVDPNANDASNDDENKDKNDADADADDDAKGFILDPDHRLLLRSTKPLLQSRNSAVVMAVAQLYYHIAPKNEVHLVAKALVRLLRSHREVQIVVLKNIVTIAHKNKGLFQQYLKNFFVHSNESIHIKLLKLEILTCLANESNISVVLREFQTYVLSSDKEFAGATIHAIGRCASSISEVTDSCLNGLVSLISKKDETIVAESVVVIKRLLQMDPTKNKEIIKHIAKMTDKVTIPMARASILWLIGEYSDHVPKIAPDVLRKMAKSFCEEEDIVKLQIINLAVKLYVINQKQTSLLVQYVLNLAKYDQNYDIRDRARFLKALTLNSDKNPTLGKHAKKILLTSKPAPILDSAYKESVQYQLGTLSHSINRRVNGYQDLPDFPKVAPDPTVRNTVVEEEAPITKAATHKGTSAAAKRATKHKNDEEKFYSDEDGKSQSTEGPDPSDEEKSGDESSEGSEESGSEEESSSGSEEESDEDDQKKTKSKSKKKDLDEASGSESEETSEDSESSSSESEEEEETKKQAAKSTVAATTVKQTSGGGNLATKNSSNNKTAAKKKESTDESSSESNESSSSESESEPETTKKKAQAKPVVKKAETKPKKNAEPVSLLDLDFSEPSVPVQSSAPITSLLTPSLAFDLKDLSLDKPSTSVESYVPKKQYELLSKMAGNGLQIQYRFPRTKNLSSNKMTNIELIFSNFTDSDLSSLKIASKKLQAGMSMSELYPINLLKGGLTSQTIGIDFNETTNAAQFELANGDASKKWTVSIKCPVGELLQPNFISENEFNANQLRLKGMNEVSAKVDLNQALYTASLGNLKTIILEDANMCQIPSSSQNIFKFSALTLSNRIPLFLVIKFDNDASRYSCSITINCEKILLANMFLKELKEILTSS